LPNAASACWSIATMISWTCVVVPFPTRAVTDFSDHAKRLRNLSSRSTGAHRNGCRSRFKLVRLTREQQDYLQWEEEMKRCSSRIALSCAALLLLFGSSSRPVQAESPSGRNCEELEVGRWNVSSDFGKRFVNQDLKNCAGGRHLRVIASETQIDCQQYETSYAPIPKHVCGDIGRPTPHYYLCIAKGLACSPRQ
jgi:hypothetical protein